LKRNGKSVVLGAADPYRPAGAEQLRVLASETVFILSRLWKMVSRHCEDSKFHEKKFARCAHFGHCRPASCRNGHASRTEYDKQTAKPQEVLLVVDAMLGQEAANIANLLKKLLRLVV